MRAGETGARAYNTIANRKTYSFESRPAAEVCAGPMSVYLRCVYLLNSDGRVTVLLSPRKLKSSGFLAEARESLIEI
jgi:hypothetical protein